MYKQILINAKLHIGKRGLKTAAWEKSIKEAKIHIGLSCHLRRRRRRYCSLVLEIRYSDATNEDGGS